MILLLMEENLHHLGCTTPCKSWEKPTYWVRHFWNHQQWFSWCFYLLEPPQRGNYGEDGVYLPHLGQSWCFCSRIGGKSWEKHTLAVNHKFPMGFCRFGFWKTWFAKTARCRWCQPMVGLLLTGGTLVTSWGYADRLTSQEIMKITNQ